MEETRERCVMSIPGAEAKKCVGIEIHDNKKELESK